MGHKVRLVLSRNESLIRNRSASKLECIVEVGQWEQMVPTCKGCELLPQASHPSKLNHTAAAVMHTRYKITRIQMCHHVSI